jgi:hypothetical protein
MGNQEESIVSDEIHEKFEGSQMSKAGRLAMELAQEKKRLQTELSELQAEYDSVAPSTPTGGPDWYLKWVGVASVVIGIFLQNAGELNIGQIFYLLGAISWTTVGIYWNDRAVMLGSVIPATATALNLARELIGYLQ